jgi:hypothetical protein
MKKTNRPNVDFTRLRALQNAPDRGDRDTMWKAGHGKGSTIEADCAGRKRAVTKKACSNVEERRFQRRVKHAG